MKSKKTRKNTVRIARALALSAFLLAAPAARAVVVNSSDQTAEVHDLSGGISAYAGAAWFTNEAIDVNSPDVELKIERNKAIIITHENNPPFHIFGTAWYAEKGLSVVVDALDINDNSADIKPKPSTFTSALDIYGGALAAGIPGTDSSANISLSAANALRIVNNIATVGAANLTAGIVSAYGGALYSTGTINLSGANTTVTGNKVTTNSTMATGAATAGGGALIAPKDITLTADSLLEITHNSAIAKGYKNSVVNGGAIYLADPYTAASSTPTVKLSADIVSIEQNYASSQITYTGTSDPAQGYGGAISAHNGYLQIDARVLNIRGNSVDVRSDHLTIDGHVYAYGGALNSLNAENQGYTIKLTAKSLDISDNHAVGNVSYGPYVYGGALAAAGRVSITAAASLDISRNTVEAIGRIYAYAKGGAIYTNTSVDISVGEGLLTISQNSAIITQRGVDEGEVGGDVKVASGGAVYSFGDIALTASSIRLVSNDATASNTKTFNADKGYGGALYSNAGSILLSATDELLVRDNTVSIASTTANTLSAYGGAIYAPNGTVSISTPSADLSGNRVTVSDKYNIAREHDATAWGGLMVAKDLQLLSVESLSLKDNHAIAESLQIKPTALGGALYISGNTTLSLTAQSLDVSGNSVRATSNTTDSNNSANASGGAIYTAGDVSLTGTNSLVLRGNSADVGNSIGTAQGGAIWSNGAVSLSGGTLRVEDNKASSSGGAVWAKGAITLSGDTTLTVSGNVVSRGSQGGALASSSGKATLKSGTLLTIENNRASGSDSVYGGAVYAYGDIELTVPNGEVVLKGNRSEGTSGGYGGALYTQNGVLSLTAQSFDISGNSVLASQHSDPIAMGGAIYSPSAFTMTGAKRIAFTSNSADSLGTTRSSATHGGALWVGGDVLLSADTLVARDNVAQNAPGTAKGGVVYATSDVTLEAVSIDYSSNVVKASNTSNVEAEAYGGSIYAGGAAKLTATDIITFTANSADAHSGTSKAYGGAIWANAGIELSADKLAAQGNVASGVSTAEGGVLYSKSGVTLRGVSIDYSGNSAKAAGYTHGGAIYADGAIKVIAAGNITLSDNTTVATNSSSGSDQGGGAIWANDSVILSAGAEQLVSNNTVMAAGSSVNAFGGAVYSASDVTLEGMSVDYRSNNVKSDKDAAYGGAIYAGDTLNLTNVKSFSITSNSADAALIAQGGALWLGKSVTLNAESIVAHDNHAKITTGSTTDHGALGGAVYSAADVKLEGLSIDFSSNNAQANGNYTKARGGAVYSLGNVKFTGNEVKFEANSADARGANTGVTGGAIYADSTVTFEGTKIILAANEAFVSGDTSGADGGAIYADSGAVEITGETIELSANTAHGRGVSTVAYGGAIYAEDGDIAISGNVITLSANCTNASNESQGGALYAEWGSIVLTSTGILTIENNIATTQEGAYTATGGAIYAYWDAVELTGMNALKVIGNKAQVKGNSAWATGGAIHGEDAVTLIGGAVTLSENNASLEGNDGHAHGGVVYAPYYELEVTGTSITITNNYSAVSGESGYATGGAFHVEDDVTMTSEGPVTISGNYAVVEGNDSSAYGGALYVDGIVTMTSDGPVTISGNYAVVEGNDSGANGGVMYATDTVGISGTTLTVTNNYASATGTDSTVWGGAFLIEGDLTLEADDSIYFSGNYAESGTLSRNASLGGAVYAIGNVDMTAKSLTFATATDDVLSRSNITITGALTAVPGTAFTAGGQFSMGDGSSLTLTGKTFTDVKEERNPGDLTIFGGIDNDPEQAINFNRASLALSNYGDLAPDGDSLTDFKVDVATVLYQNNPGFIASGADSADITFADWAPDVSKFRRSGLYIHSAVESNDEQVEAIKEKLGYEYVAKLVLAYKRHTLIWRGLENKTWDEARDANDVWVMAGDKEEDYFTPVEKDGRYVADSFYRGDIVVFDGKAYDSLDPSSVTPLSGTQTVTLDGGVPELVAPERVYLIGGQYVFTGEADLTVGSLFASGDATSAKFEVPVSVGDLVNIDAASLDFASLAAQINTPVQIGGSADVTIKDVSAGDYTVSAASLTLAGGSGSMTSLSLGSGATLNVNVPSAYGVTNELNVGDGTQTNFNFGSWEAGSGWGLGGSGTASAQVSGSAQLAINGIDEGTTGSWLLLNNFAKIAVADSAWDYSKNTLKINGRSDLDNYAVWTENAGTSYVLLITPPEGNLIWNGTGSDEWSVGTPWLKANSDDLDTPYEYEGRRFSRPFASGDVVTFNAVGEKQQDVVVNKNVSSAMVRITAGDYTFSGDGGITASTLLLDDSRFGTGTKAQFNVPVHVTELLSSGADTTALLSDLSLELSTPANVSGKLEVANVQNGAFTVNDGGELTLSGGSGSMTSIELGGGSTLNVNDPGKYSVKDSLNVGASSQTNFNFESWGESSSFGLDGSGSAQAMLANGAQLTVHGIANGAKGTWTLLNNFTGVEVGENAWKYIYDSADSTLTIVGRDDLADYIVTTGVENGKNYVLTITRPEGELIWNGTGSDVWSAGLTERPWLIASDDLDTPFEYEGRTFPDVFADGKIVTFNGVGTAQQNVTVSGDVHTPQLRVTAGEYQFSGSGEITADSLLFEDKFEKGAKASFDVTVNVSESLESGANTQAWLADLNMGEETEGSVSGRLELERVSGGIFTVNEGGILTLFGGTGTLTGLTVDSSATLNVNTSSAYSVGRSFTAADGSTTVFDFGGAWAPDDGSWGIGGSGSDSTATLSGGAKLTIVGIANGAQGTWILLDGFGNVTADAKAWSYKNKSLVIDGRTDLDDYIVVTKVETTAVDGVEGNNYVLTITRPEGELIWNGTGSDTWSAGSKDRPWLIASDDLDTPYEYEGRTFPDTFADGKIVTFNSVGTAQQNVTVSGDVHTPQLRVTAGEYQFSGTGEITADSLLLDDKFEKGAKASFDVTVNVSESLESGTNTQAWLAELNMGEETEGSVSGRLELERVNGGIFTVNEGGTLTLSGGTGTLTGLTVNERATLNVDTLSSYSVTGVLKIESDSKTFFRFADWAPNDNSTWAIGGGRSATLASGATLTIEGIASGATGKWTLLKDFKDISADGWTANDITIDGYDLKGYTVTAYRDGSDYVLEITQDTPPVPPTPDGDLIWNGTGSDTWSAGSTAKPWLIASSDDPDVPYEEGGTQYPASYADGKNVTFNNVGAQQNVNVADAVSPNRLRVTGGDYEFSGDGSIIASELMTANEGTTATFSVPVSVTKSLDIGADTKAKLADLTMELNTPANVSGSLELANVSNGVFTVNDGGALTLAGGSGTFTSLTVNSGATLNVNALSSYSVSDSFSALGGSETFFNFSNWTPNDSGKWAIAGGNSATLASGAKLTISGIASGATGKWTLLSGFKSITAGGWSASNIMITGYDWTGYTMNVYADGEDYVLEITKDEPPTPEPAGKGHTEVFHIAGSVQTNVSAAAESAALGQLAFEPDPNNHIWASMWRENGRVSDSGLIQKNRAYGIVVGRDFARDEERTWGVAAHIGKGDTSGKGAWDGATSDTTFWGLMLYGRRDTDKWLFTGDAGANWFRTDYTEAGDAKADNARATLFSIGGRAYYKWVDDTRAGKMNVYPFVGLRWNRYRQSAYGYDSGDRSAAWTADQILVPFGVKFAWGENVSPRGWRTSPSVELSYTRTFGDRSARTGIFSQTASKGVDTPLSARDTFGAQVRFNARRNTFQMDLNAGVRKSSSETDFNVGATFKWEL